MFKAMIFQSMKDLEGCYHENSLIFDTYDFCSQQTHSMEYIDENSMLFIHDLVFEITVVIKCSYVECGDFQTNRYEADSLEDITLASQIDIENCISAMASVMVRKSSYLQAMLKDSKHTDDDMPF